MKLTSRQVIVTFFVEVGQSTRTIESNGLFARQFVSGHHFYLQKWTIDTQHDEKNTLSIANVMRHTYVVPARRRRADRRIYTTGVKNHNGIHAIHWQSL